MRTVHALAAGLAMLLVPAVAAAHELRILVQVRGETFHVEAGYYYSTNEADPAEAAAVTVTDADGNRVAGGATDEKGVWTFPRPPAGTYTVVVEQAGHRAEATLPVPAQGAAAFLPSRLDKRVGVAVGLAVVLGITFAYGFLRRRRNSENRTTA